MKSSEPDPTVATGALRPLSRSARAPSGGTMNDKTPLFSGVFVRSWLVLGKMVRPERFELPTPRSVV